MKTDIDISYWKDVLKSKQKEVLERLVKIKKDKTMKNGPLDSKWDDQAIALQNKDVIDELDDLERKEIVMINNALLRIEQGTFGKCTSCGLQISSKRLKALPHALECTDCADT